MLTLADHAQNGFFRPSEWIGVVAGAMGCRLSDAMVVVPENRAAAGHEPGAHGDSGWGRLLGFYLHTPHNWNRQTGSLWDTFLYGAPLFAPLLFADLALLAMLGLWGAGSMHCS